MLSEIQNKLGYSFVNLILLEQALTHKSISSDSNYEHLEFIGDHILGMVISISLFEIHSKYSIGQLARHYNNCVNEICLIDIANKLDLVSYIRVSKDIINNKIDSILADVCESIIGAIFLDSNYSTIESFIKKNWHDKLYSSEFVNYDSKSELQELTQKLQLGLPRYELLQVNGSAHSPEFTIKVIVENFGTAEGMGPRKQIAERNAAKKLLEQFNQFSKE